LSRNERCRNRLSRVVLHITLTVGVTKWRDDQSLRRLARIRTRDYMTGCSLPVVRAARHGAPLGI